MLLTVHRIQHETVRISVLVSAWFLCSARCPDHSPELIKISTPEFLDQAGECVVTGFVPPVLARVLYQDVNLSSSRPTSAVTKGWGSEHPKLTSRREAGPFSRFEIVRAGTHWFRSETAALDFQQVVLDVGVTAATESNSSDHLLQHGPPQEYKQPDRLLTTSFQDPLLRKASFGVCFAVAPRAEAPLPAQELSDAAVEQLKSIRLLLRRGDGSEAREAILAFFRRFGTHMLPGPVLFGGLVMARSEEVTWRQAGSNDAPAAQAQTECELRKTIAAFGVTLPCNTSASPGGYFTVPRCWASATRGGARPASLPATSDWLGTVQWSREPATSWAVVDRGSPRRVTELISVDRDPALTRGLRTALEEEYVGLWLRANPAVLHAAAAAGDAGGVKELLKRGAGVEARDAEGRTALHAAAWEGQREAARALLERGARPGSVDRGRGTALHLAAARDHGHVIEELLRFGADAAALDGGGLSPLQLAASTRSRAAEAALQRHAHAEL